MRSSYRDLCYPTNMALSCLTSVRTTLRGVVSHQWLVSRCGVHPTGCEWARRCVSQSRSSTEEQKSTEEEDEGPEYIPTRKGKNPMIKIGYAWMIGLPTGIIGFLLAKRQVDKNRLKQLKIRQRMKQSNKGEYEGSRYRHNTDDIAVTR